jgi:peptidoglycan/xylan/chitin deacetylase (PgdA/CDA1 family)
MTQLETALMNIIGKFPTYMRPPYFSYTQATLQTLGGLGYKVIDADIDTLDWQYNTAGGISQSINIFKNGLASGGTLALAHDVHSTTASPLTLEMIKAVKASGRRGVFTVLTLQDIKHGLTV